MPLEMIIGMDSKVNASVTDVTSFVLICMAPLNLVKGTLVCILTMLLYKRLVRPLFGK